MLARMTTATQIERPETVYAEYWPAAVLMPDGSVRRNVRVYLTDTGAHLFFTRPTDDLAPGFTAAIDFEATPPPNIHARNIGVDVYLASSAPEGGGEALPLDLLVITPTGMCGCGSTLKTWKPSWASSVSPWPGT